MSRQERTGIRDLTYSGWHRTLADDLTYIDIDGCEYCADCREPLVLIETARDVGQTNKPTTVLQRLASRAEVPAICVLYRVEAGEIVGFRTRTVYPIHRWDWHKLTPAEFAAGLTRLRTEHECASAESAAA